jgi:hypothetical protein
VHHRVDVGYWAHQLQQDPEAQQLLLQIHQGVPDPVPEEVDLGARALGLEPGDVGKRALARRAVAHESGTVRHTAALALAALGLDAVHEGMATLTGAAPSGRWWHAVQALAQIKAADFPLPQLPSSLLMTQVNAWRAGIKLFNDRWRLVAQAVGSGPGGGLGLMACMASICLAANYRKPGEIYSYLLVGGVVGTLFASGRWLLDILMTHRVARVLGGAVGFCLGLLALWPFMPQLSGGQLLGGLLAGTSLALGWEILSGREATGRLRRAALGGALGGMLGFGVTALSPLRLPFVLQRKFVPLLGVTEEPWVSVVVVLLAALAGAATGAGLATGGTVGAALWGRLSEAN